MNQNVQALNNYAPAFFELDMGDVDEVSGGRYFSEFLSWGQGVYSSAPPTAQFLLHVGAGATFGALGGPAGIFVGAVAGGVGYFLN